MKHWLWGCMVLGLSVSVMAQTVIYEDNFDSYTSAQVPNRWTRTVSPWHVDQAEYEDAVFGAASLSGWTSFGDGYDADRLQYQNDPKQFSPLSTWKSAPGADFSQVGPNNRILVADPVIHSAQFDAWIISDAFDVANYNYVVFEMESFYRANQDQQAWLQYRLNETGNWKRLILFNDIYNRDEGRYYGPYRFTIDVSGAGKIQFRMHMQGTWSWLWAMDKLKLTGYTSVPATGPGKPTAVSPTGTVPYIDTVLQASPYSGAGNHVFSQWQIRQANGTYGEMQHDTYDPEGIAWLETDPILDTGIQPNIYAMEAGSHIRYEFSGDLIKFTVPRSVLRPGITYYWRVRYWNNNNQCGPWSDEVQFKVGDVQGTEVLAETFDDLFDGEVPANWTLENTNSDDPYHDGDFTAVGVTRPRHRSSDVFATDWDAVWSDGSGRHGGFRGNVIWATASKNLTDTILSTPPLDFTNAQGAAIMFDSNFKGPGIGYVDVVVGEGEPVNIIQVKTWAGLAVRQSVEYALVPDVAGKSNVRFQFHTNKTGYNWSFDNVRIISLSDLKVPERPSVVSPVEPVAFPARKIDLVASLFVDPLNETHAASQFQLARANKGFAFPIVDTLVQEGDLTRYTVRNLAPGHNYIWRVKYITHTGRESSWMDTATLTVAGPTGGTLILSEGFDNQEGQTVPAGWSQINNNSPDGYAEFNGWSFLTLEFFESYQQGRAGWPYFTGKIADADSDEYQNGNNGYFNSALISPTLQPNGQPLLLVFDSLYRHYTPQIGEVNYSLDNGTTWQNLIRYDDTVYSNDDYAPMVIMEEIPNAAQASQVKVMWKLYGTDTLDGQSIFAFNCWWWAIDNVRVFTAPGGVPVVLPDTPVPNPTAPSIAFEQRDITLSASAYSDPDNEAHTSSQWQVARSYAEFNRSLIDRTVSEGDLTSTVVSGLAPGYDYKWRVRYTSIDGRNSEWSEPRSFHIEEPAGATLALSQNFDVLSGQTPPPNWTHINNNTPDGYAEFNGWSYLDLNGFWIPNYGQDRGTNPHMQNIAAVADSDEYQNGANGYFNSELITPVIPTNGGHLLLAFDNFYRHYTPQIGEVNYSTDGGANWLNLIRYDDSVLQNDEFAPYQVIEEIPGSASATGVKIMWKLYGGDTFGGNSIYAFNCWWWAFDNVKIYRLGGGTSSDDWMIH